MRFGIEAAVDEMARLRKLELERGRSRERVSRAIKAIDAALDGLERLNLEKCPELPEGLERQITLVLGCIPPEMRPAIWSREPVQILMDDLFRTQDRLLALRSGPEWDELRESEAELLPSA